MFPVSELENEFMWWRKKKIEGVKTQEREYRIHPYVKIIIIFPPGRYGRIPKWGGLFFCDPPTLKIYFFILSLLLT